MEFSKPSDLVAWTLKEDFGNKEANATIARYYRSFARNFGPLRRKKYDDQLEEITRLVRAGVVKSVIDVGCGCGSVALWLSLQGAKVTGIDIQKARLDAARARAKHMGLDAKFEFQNLFEIDGKFDAIWMEQVFHHIEPRNEVYPRVAELLNPQGRIFISEANGWNPIIQALMFRARGFDIQRTYTDESGRKHPYAMERITIPAVLKSGFKRQGIRALTTIYYGILPNTRSAERFSIVEHLVPSFLIPAFSHYLWVGQK